MFEDTIYDDQELSFESEHTDDAVKFIPDYEGQENSKNFTEGLMEVMGYEPGNKGDYGLEMHDEDKQVTAEVDDDGLVYFPKDQEGDLLEAVDRFREQV